MALRSAAPARPSGSSATPHRGALVTLAVLVAVIVCGTAVRMAPWFEDPGLQLKSDAAYHERLVLALVREGRLPSPDRFSEAPAGRRIGPLLPQGLYSIAAAACHLTGARDEAGVHRLLLWLTAVAGALIALPVWVAARALYPHAGAALIAAALAALMPAHVHRTVCYWVRYDAIGTLLVTTHLAFAFRALAEPVARRRLDSILSALALVAAITVWRVPLMVPLLETGFVAIVAAWSGARRALREWFAIGIAAVLLASPAIEYLHAQRFVLSPAWFATVAVALALFLPALAPERPRGMRVAVLASALALGWLGGSGLAPPSPYGGALELLWFKLGQLVSPWTAAGPPPTPLTSLLYQVEELYALTPLALLVGPQQFLALGPWCLVAPLLFRWLDRGQGGDPRSMPGSAHALLAYMTACLALLTFLMLRNKVLLAPLVAIVCAGLFAALRRARPAGRGRDIPSARPARARRSTRDGGGGTRAPSTALVAALTALLAASFVATSVCGVALGLSRTSRLIPGEDACMAWLRSHAAPGTVVLAPVDYGYDLQRHAGCASLTDGLFESPVNLRRIAEIDSVLFADGDTGLLEVCRRDRVGFLLVPPGNALYGMALVVQPPFLSRLERGLPLEAADLERPLMRLMLGERTAPAFVQVFENAGYRLYRVAPRAGASR